MVVDSVGSVGCEGTMPKGVKITLNSVQLTKLLTLHDYGVSHAALAARFNLGTRATVTHWLKIASDQEYHRLQQKEVHDKSWQNLD